MPKISVLSDLIASQIAAGEVVERPASAVKELVENSLDACADFIEIQVSKDCLDFTITDNGLGMDPDDAILAFERHATSKITNFEDLRMIVSFGFRGEALNSIASVAKINCQTKTKDQKEGSLVEVVNGNIKVSQHACAVGTKIEVLDLFFNVPARQKFLKKPKTEFSQIYEIIQALAIANSKVRFRLKYDNHLSFETSGSNSILTAAIETNFIHKDYAKNFIHTENNIDDKSLKAVLSNPQLFKHDRKGILAIVNGRVVRCPVILKVLDNCYNDIIPRGRYPIAIILLNIAAQDVDVNIHPTKKEIRYADGVNIFQLLQANLSEALRNNISFTGLKHVEDISSDTSNNIIVSRLGMVSSDVQADYMVASNFQQSYINDKALQSAMQSVGTDSFGRTEVTNSNSYFNESNDNYDLRANKFFRQESSLASALKENVYGSGSYESLSLPWDFKLIGYLNNTYFLLMTQDGLLIVEQHIAHERINYEELLAKSTLGKDAYSQKLALPIALNLSQSEKTQLEENITPLEKFGFEFVLQDNSYNLTAIPVTLSVNGINEILVKILSELQNGSNDHKNIDALKSIACQSAIKNGMFLNNVQIVDLLTRWYHTPRNDTCPHGRPIAISLTTNKLFNMFHPQ